MAGYNFNIFFTKHTKITKNVFLCVSAPLREKVTRSLILEDSLPTATLATVALAKVAAYCHFNALGRPPK